MRFTQEIKDKWLSALKSGKYIQAKGQLVVKESNSLTKAGYCCIGVLGEICDFLDNAKDANDSTSPYYFLNTVIGNTLTDKLWQINDRTYDINKPDYSNVIPIIEQLYVQD